MSDLAQTGAAEPEEDMFDILGDSLETLDPSYRTVAFSTANALFTYTDASGAVLQLRTPDTAPANWALHASSVWVSALFLADHLAELRLGPAHAVLELGAGAGLPGILCARQHPAARVVVSDYPDAVLLAALADNVARAAPGARCTAVGHAWGADPAPLLADAPDGFDVVICADTLWNGDAHALLLDSLTRTLRRAPESRVHLVAGLHTGRWVLQRFLEAAEQAGFARAACTERAVRGDETREWDAEREEDEAERRRWVVWIQLRWKDL